MFVTLSPSLCRLHMEFLVSLCADQDWDPPWTSDSFLVERPGKWDLSFMLEGKAAAILSRPEPGRAHLHLLAVLPGERDKGIGSGMMAEMIRRAGEDRLTLKVPYDSKGARRFYARHGFRMTGYADSRWWMELQKHKKALAP